ncbi:putative endonuclease [Prosthecobacter debontii]|uniref:Putative endonuclease n=1 Tax=Prosthecobacter debontii TaxID=48467 RepID=A0A1T4YYM6_9BACT|nr:GIY-YIG nuclease family protein [Prosthecobacter debontii]SKB06907.1 putative endonuclease [Prosthecobacter debontii]
MANDLSAASEVSKPWCLYVLRCRDGSLYCGITNDLYQRLDKHQQGKGARYTRGRGPLWLLGSWPQVDMPTALRAERAFKALSKAQKEKWLEEHLQPS